MGSSGSIKRRRAQAQIPTASTESARLRASFPNVRSIVPNKPEPARGQQKASPIVSSVSQNSRTRSEGPSEALVTIPEHQHENEALGAREGSARTLNLPRPTSG